MPSNSPYPTGEPYVQSGLLRVAGPSQVVEMLRNEEARQPLNNDSPEVSNLVGYLRSVWDTNREHKTRSGVAQQMIDNLQARNSEYDESMQQAIQAQGGSDVFMGLTGVKCRAAEAWILDVFASTDQPWGLKPSPVPALHNDLRRQVAEEVQQSILEAIRETGEEMTPEITRQLTQQMLDETEELTQAALQTRVKEMEKTIQDQLFDGGWADAFEEFVTDLVTLKAGIIKGPIPRIRKRKEWSYDANTGKYSQTVTEYTVPEFYRVSPFDIFPSPEATCIQDGSLVERQRLSRQEIIDLKEVEGYDKKAINAVLESYPNTEHTRDEDEVESEREDAEARDPDMEQFSETVEALEFWCSVQGKILKTHGVEKGPRGGAIKDLEEYHINAIMVAGTIIYLNFNDDPIGERPYVKYGWGIEPGSFWYKGIPELMCDLQRVCNASMRALMNNMAVASGPQAEVDTRRLPPGEVIESIRPFKIWQTTNKMNSSAPAVRFFQPQSNASELLTIYDRFAQLADDYTGIPAYAYGNERVAGAGRTASGLSALMSAAAKGIKRVLLGMDRHVIRPIIKRQFDWNRAYMSDRLESDAEIISTGVVAVMAREQLADRRLQFLQLVNDEANSQLIGVEGRAALLREIAETLEMPGKELVPSGEKLRDKMDELDEASKQAQQMQKQAMEMEQQKAQISMMDAQMKAQKTQADIQLKAMELRIKEAELMLKAQLGRSDLGIKARKVDAEAQKDMAVAMDLGVRNLAELSPEPEMDAELDMIDDEDRNREGVDTKQ